VVFTGFFDQGGLVERLLETLVFVEMERFHTNPLVPGAELNATLLIQTFLNTSYQRFHLAVLSPQDSITVPLQFTPRWSLSGETHCFKN
jgi:hypothetical protein